MGYDTLILSGGSVKGCALLGSFKYLIDHEKINIKKLINNYLSKFLVLSLIFNKEVSLYTKFPCGL